MIRNYNQLTIKQFLQCRTVADLEPDPVQRKLKMLSAVSGKDIEELESLPLEELFKRLKEFSQVESLQPEAKVRIKFKVKGQRFKCVWKVQELTASQYIDATHFAKDPENVISNIHNILAAICVRRTWYGKSLKYNGDEHKEVAELFYNHMKISQAYPIMLFFCKYSEALERNILTCLTQEVARTRQAMTRSMQSGGGSQR